jgi:hypothetical protein
VPDILHRLLEDTGQNVVSVPVAVRPREHYHAELQSGLPWTRPISDEVIVTYPPEPSPG